MSMTRFFVSITLLLAYLLPANADTESDFYSGKTVTIIIGSPPGGAYDLYARGIAHFLPNHLPGRPAVIVRNMP